MSRYKYYGYARDGHGHVINNATVYVYLGGSNTAASVYSNNSGGTAVNYVKSGNNGLFEFYVDDSVYSSNQTFKITITKEGFTSSTIDNISIFPGSLTSLISRPTYSDDYPRLVCNNGFVTELAPANGSIRIYADHCVVSAYSGTPPYTYYMRKAYGDYGSGSTTASNVYLSYDNPAPGIETFYVKITDAANRSAVCQLYLTIQDNQGFGNV